MNPALLALPIIIIVGAAFISVAAESPFWRRRISPWLHRVMHPGEEEPKEPGAVALPWYWQRSVETGVLEVALAFTATAMALPTFIGSFAQVPSILVWLFEGVLLVAAVMAAACSFWLFRIYVRQLMLGAGATESQSIIDVGTGNVFSVRAAGPYALLAYAMILLLIGLSMLPLIVAI